MAKLVVGLNECLQPVIFCVDFEWSMRFTRDFLNRHQDKLMFGSDCGCTDGHGAGISQGNNPAAARLAGKCVARETLTVLKRSASDAVFRKITWGNVHTLLKIPAQ